MVILFNAVQKVVCGLNFENNLVKDIFTSRLYRYVQNDEKHYKEILKVVSGLKWIKNKEINDYFYKYFLNNYSEKNLFINYKTNPKSSSSRLISYISGEGLCNDFQIININDLTTESIRKFDNIYFIDDYIGSGSTVIESIDSVWNIIKDKKIYIVCYAIQYQALLNIDKKYSSLVMIEKELLLEDYKSNYDKNTVSYIKKVCEFCPEQSIKYGYNSAGAYVVLHNTVPNSDISMLWYPRIIYNNNKWTRLFDRELSLELLIKKNKEMIKSNEMLLRKKYKDLEKRFDIDLPEFKFLVYSYGCYYTKNQLIDDKYFDSKPELDSFLQKLITKNYICINKGCILISNKLLYYEIGKIVDYLYKEKSKMQKKITYNF